MHADDLPDGLKTRLIAFDILRQVLIQKTPLDQVLSQHDKMQRLEPRDRNFVRMMVATCLRRKGQMDDLIARCLDKPQALKPETLPLVLYIGICQIIFMDVPDHAAVDTTVRLAEAQQMERQKGFVNALLRRITGEGRVWVQQQDAIKTCIPAWLLTDWIADYGLVTATQIAEASLTEAAVDMTVKHPDEQIYWAGELEGSVLPTGSIRLKTGAAMTKKPGFESGAWWVQDASSALPVSLMGDDLSGKRIVDLCAAPGGKTAQLLAKGARVTAVDRSANRIKLLKENLTRLNFMDQADVAIEVVVADGAVWKPSMPVDTVLLDAPCSATGTLRRHPDVMHLKNPEDTTRLCELQFRLLENAATIVRDGGLIFYCTCSLQKAEGERQVDAFLNRHQDFERLPFEAGDLACVPDVVTESGDIRIRPFHMAPQGGMDGFFIARLRKKPVSA